MQDVQSVLKFGKWLLLRLAVLVSAVVLIVILLATGYGVFAHAILVPSLVKETTTTERKADLQFAGSLFTIWACTGDIIKTAPEFGALMRDAREELGEKYRSCVSSPLAFVRCGAKAHDALYNLEGMIDAAEGVHTLYRYVKLLKVTSTYIAQAARTLEPYSPESEQLKRVLVKVASRGGRLGVSDVLSQDEPFDERVQDLHGELVGAAVLWIESERERMWQVNTIVAAGSSRIPLIQGLAGLMAIHYGFSSPVRDVALGDTPTLRFLNKTACNRDAILEIVGEADGGSE